MPFYALDVDMTAGGQAGAVFDWRSYKYDPSADTFTHTDTNTTYFSFGAWLDLEYARLSADYAVGFDGNVYSIWEVAGFGSSSNNGLPSGWSQQELIITLIGKYPFSFGELKLCPQAGFAFRAMTDFDIDGDGNSEAGTSGYEALNDFYLVFGSGLELPVNSFLVIFDAQYGINLTSNPSSDPLATNVTYYWNNLKLNLGVGFGI
jgi:hypothetical protein